MLILDNRAEVTILSLAPSFNIDSDAIGESTLDVSRYAEADLL